MSLSGISSGFVWRALLTKVGEIILNSSQLCPWTFRKFNPRAWGYYGILVTIETQLHQTRNNTCIANYMKGWCHKIWPRTIYFIDISCWTMGDCSPCLPTNGDRDKPTVNLFNLNLRFDSYYYTTKLLGGIWVSLRPSVRPSVRPASRVRSVTSTVLVGSISYLYILSSNFRRCVAYKVSSKISKFDVLAIFWDKLLIHS